MKALLLSMGLALSFNVLAQHTYICTHADSTRIIDVIYTQPGELVPCEVKYTKSTGEQVLWRAQGQVGYCEEKAQAFAQKQEGFGWKCAQMADSNDGSLEPMPVNESASVEAPKEMAEQPVQMEQEADKEVQTESMQKPNLESSETPAEVEKDIGEIQSEGQSTEPKV